MATTNTQDMQSQAIAFVHYHRSNIVDTACRINPRITQQDYEDLVAEGYAIALELVAAGGMARLKEGFWGKLQRSVWDGYDYLVDTMDLSSMEVEEARGLSAADPLERMIDEQQFVETTSSVLDFLSAAEKRVLCLMLGLTSTGCCVEEEAARHLGISRSSIRVYVARIIAKITTATRLCPHDGPMVLSRGKPRQLRPPHLASL